MGITETTLRWLVHEGYAEHLLEITAPSDKQRTFMPCHNLHFSHASSFQLTSTGSRLAAQLCTKGTNLLNCWFSGGWSQLNPTLIPQWDSREKIFCVGEIIVKQFKVPAATQEVILNAFEEERWPSHLDDPLPPIPGHDSKQRLHDAIKRLNRQNSKMIQFAGDGRGQGVRWRFAHSPNLAPHRPQIDPRRAEAMDLR